MATSLGELVMAFKADTSDLTRGTREAQNTVKNFSSSLGSAGAGLGGFGGFLKNATSTVGGFASSLLSVPGKLLSWGTQLGMTVVGVRGLASAVTDFVGNLFGANARLEQTKIAFTQMMGSASAAQQFINELWDFAKRTPFEFPNLVQSAQMLMGVGIAAKEVIPWMRGLGDAVSATGGSSFEIQRVTVALTQMAAKGKISAEEMMQLTEARIPAWNLLAAGMGKSTAELMKMSQQSKLMSAEALPILIAQMEKVYGGQMAAQAGTFNGIVSTLKDTWADLNQVLLQPAFLVVKGWIDQLGKALDNADMRAKVEGWGKVVGAFVGQFGTWVGTNLIPALKGFLAGLMELGPQFQGVAQAAGGLFGAVRDLAGALFSGNGNAGSFAKTVGTVLLDAIRGVLDLAATLVGKLAGFIQACKDGQPWAVALATAIGALAGALLAVKVALTVTSVFSTLVSVLGVVCGVVSGAIPLFGGLGVAITFATGPVGIIIMAIGLLVGAFIALWNLCPPFRDFFQKTLPAVLSTAWNAVSGFVTGAWNALKGLVGWLVNFGKGLVDGITAPFRAVLSWLGIDTETLRLMFVKVFSLISAVVIGTWNGIWSFLSGLWNTIKSVATTVFGAIAAVMSGIWNGVWGAVKSVWDRISGYISTAWNAIKNVLNAMFGPIVNAIKGPFEAAFNAVKGAVRGGLQWVIDRLNDGIRGFEGFLNGIKGAINGVSQFLVKRDLITKNASIPRIPALPMGSGISPASGGGSGGGFSGASAQNGQTGGIGDFLKKGWDWLTKGPEGILKDILGSVGMGDIPTGLTDFFGALKDRVGTAIKDAIGGLLNVFGGGGTAAAGNGPLYQGAWRKPLNAYRITQFYAGQWPAHSGIDLAASTGTPIYAAGPGKVVQSLFDPVGGNLVKLYHGGNLYTYYGHMSRRIAAAGQMVPQGAILGLVGSTGNSTGPHLHFEFDRGGMSVNPLSFLRLATGGIVNGPTLALLGDNPSGREAVVPLDGGASGLMGDITLPVTVVLGDTEIKKVVRVLGPALMERLGAKGIRK